MNSVTDPQGVCLEATPPQEPGNPSRTLRCSSYGYTHLLTKFNMGYH